LNAAGFEPSACGYVRKAADGDYFQRMSSSISRATGKACCFTSNVNHGVVEV
jgi:hypothetical protein